MATYVAAWEDENYDIEHIEVDEIEQVTDTSVRIIGKIEYEPDGMSETDTEMDSFIIEATINPESIFGGYTFNTMYIFDTEEVANDYFKLEEDSWKKLYIDFYSTTYWKIMATHIQAVLVWYKIIRIIFYGMSQVMACRSYLCKINGAV